MIRREPELKKLKADVREAKQLAENGQLAAARERFVGLRTRAEELGVGAGYLIWFQAELAAQLGDPMTALDLLAEASAVDPLNPSTQGSFNSVCARLRSELADPEKTAAVYKKLAWAGETDLSCHLAMVRFLMAASKGAEALKLIEAVTLLAPASVEAWRLRLSLAAELGDGAAVEACEEVLGPRIPVLGADS